MTGKKITAHLSILQYKENALIRADNSDRGDNPKLSKLGMQEL